MNKCAILHIPLSEYAYAEDEHTIRIRLRAEKYDLNKCCVFYGDRVAPINPIPVKKIEMKLTARDELFDYYEAVIKDRYTRVCYYFALDDGKESLFYYGRGLRREITDNRTEFFQFPYIRREDIIKIPVWAQNAVMYQIFPDSFANGKRYLSECVKEIDLGGEGVSKSQRGGTLKGVEENLDYLENLGINCIYFNPIFKAASYHKYDIIDYFQVDPCFGSNEDLKHLVQACHERNIKVILDGVFNHCGTGFMAFQDVLKNGKKSDYYDWFYQLPEKVLLTDPPEYAAFAYVKEMPKLNTGNPEVAAYFAGVGQFWIREADIDGWRLDVANEVNHEFWRIFKQQVCAIKQEVFLIGEIWEDAQCWLMGDQFDSTMNYPFSYICRDFFADRKISVKEFDQQLHRMLMRYPACIDRVQMNFLDTHDVPRFLSHCRGDKKSVELAMFFMLMMVGIPSIFYGDEAYIEGETENAYRKAMPWKDGESRLYHKIKEWISLRKSNEALRKGEFITRYMDEEAEIYFFERSFEENKILVGINHGMHNAEVPCKNLNCESLVDLLTGERISEKVLFGALEGKVFQL